MRYLYKQTGIVVESDAKLDSMMFRPVTEKTEQVEEPVKKSSHTAKDNEKKDIN